LLVVASSAVLACEADLRVVDSVLDANSNFPDFDSGNDQNWNILQKQFEEVELTADKQRFESPLGQALWSGSSPLKRSDWHQPLLESWGVAQMTYQSQFIFGLKKETSLKKVCFSIYQKMKDFVAQGILPEEDAAFLSLYLRVTDPETI